jgi:hypothetical protein
MNPVVVLGLVALLTGCDAVSKVLPSPQIDCDGTEPNLCEAVARLAISRMNLVSTGRIVGVELIRADCAALGRSSFQIESRLATDCWRVGVTGEKSHGGGVIVRHPDGGLEANW